MSTPETTTNTLHPRWPASRFYWAVFTPDVLGNLGPIGTVPRLGDTALTRTP